jgi:nucleoside-diphosphate-sugar epimerase
VLPSYHPSQAMEGETPHRDDTPMVDVRDCALAHIEAAERPDAAGRRFILSTPTAVPRARLLQLLGAQYPSFAFADGGAPPEPAAAPRELFRSLNTGSVLTRTRTLN